MIWRLARPSVNHISHMFISTCPPSNPGLILMTDMTLDLVFDVVISTGIWIVGCPNWCLDKTWCPGKRKQRICSTATAPTARGLGPPKGMGKCLYQHQRYTETEACPDSQALKGVATICLVSLIPLPRFESQPGHVRRKDATGF